ncbi:MAG: twin-arginine translocase TatA/TatE family subunit, partial [Candidatus Acidiferrales bacterium]
MFSVPHLIIIFAVALVVFGPEKLPELARNLGKIMGEFRRATGELRSTFEGHMRDLEREAELRRIREAQPPTQTIGGVLPPQNPPALPPEST